MIVKKRQHNLYREMRVAKSMGLATLGQLVGRWQYIYLSSKGELSLVKFINYYMDGKDFWEICSLKGELLKDVEHYDTKTEAEKRIKVLLT